MNQKEQEKSYKDELIDYHFSVYNPATKKEKYPYRTKKFDTKWLKAYGLPDHYC